MKEIKLIQYMMPSGRKVPVTTDIEDIFADMAKGMVLNCEVLGTGQVALYAKYPQDKEEEEFMEIASNGPGIQEVLQFLIKRKYEEGR